MRRWKGGKLQIKLKTIRGVIWGKHGHPEKRVNKKKRWGNSYKTRGGLPRANSVKSPAIYFLCLEGPIFFNMVLRKRMSIEMDECRFGGEGLELAVSPG